MARPSIVGMRSKTFGSSGAAKRLHLEQLPGYAPDLNPDEGIWNYLKRVELGNVCCRDLQHLSTAAMWLFSLVSYREVSR